ncbi:thiamine-binding protein [Chitinophaga nivalis]|uniref:Thiamine-binding protein n=1 Tax=Chitinophaga nivalis TaxID=2991709 RepID=A0ABT3IM80_9BACT|nr:thiamine-binding protein [Chitinophaga nivalis]MCW3465423.1 thiamine-binding protein [Chitinophaga nivalis]MCW3484885.1 thiamine-binding protein [Chitinophaga nivalis]
MNNKINLALQILPSVPSEEVYAVVDEAIAVIKASGVKYRVCPFETVMEGTYDELMEVVRKTQEVCFKAGASQLLVYIKMQIKKDQDVTIEEKTGKYD